MIPLNSINDIETSLEDFAGEPGGGVIVLRSIFMTANRDTVIETTKRLKLPAIYPFRFYATSGGLFSYGIDGDEQSEMQPRMWTVFSAAKNQPDCPYRHPQNSSW
jgi:hypothetical protein